MDTINFQCGHCGKLMAVTRELIGRQVRCPHCQQVVIAPNPDPPEPAFPPAGSGEMESIFTPPQEVEEDLFGGTTQPKPELPDEHTWQQPPEPPPVNLELTAPLPPPEQTVAYTPPTDDVPSQFASPTEVSDQPSSASGSSNPWMSLPKEPPSTFAESQPPPDEGPASFVGMGSRQRKAAPSWLLPVLIIPLISYSVVVTGLLAYCYMQLQLERSADPLEQLGDDGFNPPATKGGKTSLRGPIHYGAATVLRPLPAKLKTSLNKPLRINDLEVTPRLVEMRTVQIKTGNTRPEPGQNPSLALFLDLKNISDDVTFCPLDPWFDRHYKETPQKVNMPFTFLEVGQQKFLGGPAINDPGAREGDVRETLYFDGVDEDLSPNPEHKFHQKAERSLKPGESMRSFVCTDSEFNVRNAIKAATGPLLYRVRLRTGLTDIRGRELSTTAVIGVEFNKQDVKDL